MADPASGNGAAPEPSKDARLAAIRSILDTQPVRNQEELVELLRQRGFVVTQSSVSRDLRELEVAKVAGHYRLPDALRSPEALSVSAGVTGVQRAGPNLLVVHTVVGGASRVALGLDQSGWGEVIGTIAGDDTIFVATPGFEEQIRLSERLMGMAGS
ncbi:MAG: hypothetical protein AAF488_17205 [Planctomycetota bacterium]